MYVCMVCVLSVATRIRQLKKYLGILATSEDSVTDLNQYYQTHQDELLKIVNILNPKTTALLDEPDNFDEDDKSVESITPKQPIQKSYAGDLSIYQDEYVAQKSLRHLSEDQIDINRLLNREEPTDSIGPLKKIKQIKDNLFAKKFHRRSRKSDKQDDQISIKSTSSDTSRLSINDIKNEIKRIKKLKVAKLLKVENKEDEGIGMASILARSVMHADRSLARISETQDSESSPSSTLRRTSESEPVLSTSDNDKTMETINKDNTISNVPEIHCGSLENLSNVESVQPERKISESCPPTPMTIRTENLLKLPGDFEYYGSISSALSADSSEIYTSSDEDDESSDMRSDLEPTLETTSSVVKSVLNQGVDQNFIAQMERKLTVLELKNMKKSKEPLNTKPIEGSAEKSVEIDREIDIVDISKTQNESPEDQENNTNDFQSSPPKEMCVTKSNSHFIKIHNPFTHKKASKSISAPSSPVEKKGFMYRSSKRIKRQISKISKSNMIKSLSHYSLLPKKKHVDPKTAFSQPGSASDVTSKAPSDTVLGSPFLSYTDLMSLDKEGHNSFNRLHKSDEIVTSNVSMYIGSEPVSRASFSGLSSVRDDSHLREQKSFRKDKSRLKPTGLIHTAMETILIDKVDTLLIPTSPDPVKNSDQKFFEDVNEKLEKVEEAQIKQLKLADSSNNSAKDSEKVNRKLVRQDSIHSSGCESRKMSEVESNIVIPCKLTNAPMLQHFHPMHLETIPSLPETSFDRTDSLDVNSSTNSVSVCFNSHAACNFDRDRDRSENKCDKDRGSPKHARHESYGGKEPVATVNVQNASLNSSSTPMGIHRRSSDSDLSVTPKG